MGKQLPVSNIIGELARALRAAGKGNVDEAIMRAENALIFLASHKAGHAVSIAYQDECDESYTTVVDESEVRS